MKQLYYYFYSGNRGSNEGRTTSHLFAAMLTLAPRMAKIRKDTRISDDWEKFRLYSDDYTVPLVYYEGP